MAGHKQNMIVSVKQPQKYWNGAKDLLRMKLETLPKTFD